MIAKSALDYKLREMEHTCVFDCVPRYELHFSTPSTGGFDTHDFKLGQPIRVTFLDELRYLIARIDGVA